MQDDTHKLAHDDYAPEDDDNYGAAIDTYHDFLAAPKHSDVESAAITALVQALLAINESAVLDALTDPDDAPDPAGFERVLAITDLAHARDHFLDAFAELWEVGMHGLADGELDQQPDLAELERVVWDHARELRAARDRLAG